MRTTGAPGPQARPSALTWKQDRVAGVPLNRYVGRAGALEVGAVAFDGSNKLWSWSSPLADDAWGYAPTQEGAMQAFELWLKGWAENFRPILEQGGDGTSRET